MHSPEMALTAKGMLNEGGGGLINNYRLKGQYQIILQLINGQPEMPPPPPLWSPLPAPSDSLSMGLLRVQV